WTHRASTRTIETARILVAFPAVLKEVVMTHGSVGRFGAIRALVLVGLLVVGLVASTSVPALGGSNTWTPTGSMTTARSGHTATLLANGEVLVAGGGNATGSLTSAELYNPAKGKWAVSGSMTTARI